MKRILAFPLFVLATPVLAQSEAATSDDDNRITVVASGFSTRLDESGQAISVVGRDTIEAAQGIDITRALERVPGLTWTRNGGPGSFTSVRLRGADAEQVLVLVDGVRVEDVSSPANGFDFATLSPGAIGRIDVLRGSNSVPWGSAALGGVIAFTSRDLNGVEASAEYGTHDTLSTSAAAGIADNAGAISVNGGYVRSDGVSTASAGTEADGYRNWHAGARGRLELAPSLLLRASGRYADTRTQIDGFGPPTYSVFGDTVEFQDTIQFGGHAGLEYSGDGLELMTGVGLSDTRRDYYDPSFSNDISYYYEGQSIRWDMRGQVRLPQEFLLSFGADSEWTEYSGTYDAKATANLTSGHVLIGRTWDAGSLSVGVRRDEHDEFGGNWTFGANGTLALVENVLLRASYGEGFKAPTLFQLLSSFGNAALAPEESRSFDLGLELAGEGVPVAVSATLFRRDSRNLITFVSCASLNRCADRPSGLYDNVANARAQGIELALDAPLADDFALHAAYSYTDTENRTSGNANAGKWLARRPRHALTLAADWTPGDLSLGADVRVVGKSFDNASNSRLIDGHALVALRAGYRVAGQVEVFGRVENLFDETYETVADYGTWGRAVFIGVRGGF